MKKVLCICIGIAIIAMMGACQKECICKKSVAATEYGDTTSTVDSTAIAANATADSIMYHAGHIYDKKECEYLNISDTTTTQIITLTCSMDKIEK